MAKKKRTGFGVSDLLRNATGRDDTPPAERAAEADEAADPAAARRSAVMPAARSEERAEEALTARERAASEARPETQETEGEGHRKTSRGYVRTDGSKRKRKSLFLAEHQIRALEFLALRAGYQGEVSAFVADVLDLDAVAGDIGFID